MLDLTNKSSINLDKVSVIQRSEEGNKVTIVVAPCRIVIEFIDAQRADKFFFLLKVMIKTRNTMSQKDFDDVSTGLDKLLNYVETKVTII
jgi:hypothetical protein